MKIYYPTYYLVPVVPVISLDEEDYNTRYNDSHGISYMDGDEVHNTYRNNNKSIYEDVFAEIDEEYVNESTK